MNLSQGLLLKNLFLRGHRKDYHVPFQPGINIIYGDADTGKSSILRLIYYLLGGKQIKLDEEISSSVINAILEISINGKPYCIIRDIFNSSRDIDVYSCEYSELASNYPQKYRSNVSKGDEENKSLSDFLLDTLELPSVRLKQAPTKDSSETARLSFLDLFKFMYLDQDAVGSAHMLNIGNYVLETKNREVFKYIFNVLDSNISDLETDISKKSGEKSALTERYKTITNFLSETEFKESDDLDHEIDNIDDIKEELKERLTDLNKRMTSDNALYEGLKDALNTINLNIEEQEDIKRSSLRNIERFTRLYNDYKNDIGRIKASLSSKEVIGRETLEKTNCPICDNIIEIPDISEKFDIADDQRLKSELTSITRRSRDLQQLIPDNRTDLEKANSYLDKLYNEKSKARQIMDEELANSVSPYLAERDSIIKEMAQLEERRDKFVHSLKVRNQQNAISDRIENLVGAIQKLKIKVEQLKEHSPSLDDIHLSLGSDLNTFIQKVKINNPYGVKIDKKTFLPVVRDVEYRNINSGGLRTIVSIGYLASILNQKLRGDTNLPGLLMIDTVGKFLGKTPEESEFDNESKLEDDEGVSDPEKYKKLFEALIDISSTFDENNKLCQIFLVDNDIPPEVAHENKGFEIAHYRTNGVNGLSVGLIDDWNVAKNESRQVLTDKD